MTLEEFKRKFDGNIKLGAKKGAAFFWCGKLDALDLDELENTLTKRATENLKNADRALYAQESIPLDIVTYKAAIAHGPRKNKNISFSQWVDLMQEELARRVRYSEKLQKRMETYPRLRDRQVVDVYQSFLNADTHIVLIEGEESGRVWDTDEFVNGVNEDE